MLKMLLIGLVLAGGAFAVAAEEFTQGQQYELIPTPSPTTTGDKVEVVELFWYGCPHCYAFEPTISQWLEKKADYIEFVRIPAVFAKNWEVHARAFYAAQQLGVLDKIHEPLFEAIHKDKRELATEDQLATFFSEHGVAAGTFHEAYNSFDVDTKTRHAIALTRSYGISGVPSLIIDGKYRTSAQAAGTYDTLLKVVDFLAAKVHNR